MTLMQRLRSILLALAMLLGAFLIALTGFSEMGYLLIAVILAVSLAVSGTRTLIYYARIARHMVEGRSILYRGVITLDLGILTMAVTDFPPIVVVLYLIGTLGFTGVVNILRAREAKGFGGSWKLDMIEGILPIVFAVAALISAVFFDSLVLVSLVYAAGLAASAVLKFVTAFRRTAIVYVA